MFLIVFIFGLLTATSCEENNDIDQCQQDDNCIVCDYGGVTHAPLPGHARGHRYCTSDKDCIREDGHPGEHTYLGIRCQTYIGGLQCRRQNTHPGTHMFDCADSDCILLNNHVPPHIYPLNDFVNQQRIPMERQGNAPTCGIHAGNNLRKILLALNGYNLKRQRMFQDSLNHSYTEMDAYMEMLNEQPLNSTLCELVACRCGSICCNGGNCCGNTCCCHKPISLTKGNPMNITLIKDGISYEEKTFDDILDNGQANNFRKKPLAVWAKLTNTNPLVQHIEPQCCGYLSNNSHNIIMNINPGGVRPMWAPPNWRGTIQLWDSNAGGGPLVATRFGQNAWYDADGLVYINGQNYPYCSLRESKLYLIDPQKTVYNQRELLAHGKGKEIGCFSPC